MKLTSVASWNKKTWHLREAEIGNETLVVCGQQERQAPFTPAAFIADRQDVEAARICRRCLNIEGGRP